MSSLDIIQPAKDHCAKDDNSVSEWLDNWRQCAEAYQDILNEWVKRNKDTLSLEHLTAFMPIASKYTQLWQESLNDPERLLQAQVAWWQDCLAICQRGREEWFNERSNRPLSLVKVLPSSRDKRFHHEDWQSHPFYNTIRDIYLLTKTHIDDWLHETPVIDEKSRSQLSFFTRQLMDAASPSNCLFTNPELIHLTIENKGANLVRGLQHMLEDLKRNDGFYTIKMTDTDHFQLGNNLATTPGVVVYENELIQLIQYRATTDVVHVTPLLIIPPWINKYYILDLSSENSLVRWLVEQGHTVFMISWRNPTAADRHVTFDDYLRLGALAAIHEVRDALNVDQINAIGFCIGGTLLACAASYLTKKKDESLKTVTYMATLLDFSDPGELGVFVDEEQVKLLEEEMHAKGYMDGRKLALAFNLLRENELIWAYFTNNYLAGREPFPFDLLYWNSDSTNLPAAMQCFYLRKMYMQNRLIEPNGISLGGVPIDIGDIKQPAYFISTELDHIAPWKTTFFGAQRHTGPVRFVLGGSGHIAGIVNPPSKQKYHYRTSTETLQCKADEWLQTTHEHKGSWWTDWAKWISPYLSGKVQAREITSQRFIEEAPGKYVHQAMFQINMSENADESCALL